MPLLDDLKTVRARKKSLPEWLISRTPDERAAFEKALDDPSVAITTLCGIVRKYDGKVSRETMEALRNSRVTR